MERRGCVARLAHNALGGVLGLLLLCSGPLIKAIGMHANAVIDEENEKRRRSSGPPKAHVTNLEIAKFLHVELVPAKQVPRAAAQNPELAQFAKASECTRMDSPG
jgi:hypothetical protein